MSKYVCVSGWCTKNVGVGVIRSMFHGYSTSTVSPRYIPCLKATKSPTTKRPKPCRGDKYLSSASSNLVLPSWLEPQTMNRNQAFAKCFIQLAFSWYFMIFLGSNWRFWTVVTGIHWPKTRLKHEQHGIIANLKERKGGPWVISFQLPMKAVDIPEAPGFDPAFHHVSSCFIHHLPWLYQVASLCSLIIVYDSLW